MRRVRKYIGVVNIDGKELYVNRKLELTPDLWEAWGHSSEDLNKIPGVKLYTNTDIFSKIKILLTQHEQHVQKHEEIINKLRSLKFVN